MFKKNADSNNEKFFIVKLIGRSIDKTSIESLIEKMEKSLMWKNIRILNKKWLGSEDKGIWEFTLEAIFKDSI